MAGELSLDDRVLSVPNAHARPSADPRPSADALDSVSSAAFFVPLLMVAGGLSLAPCSKSQAAFFFCFASIAAALRWAAVRFSRIKSYVLIFLKYR